MSELVRGPGGGARSAQRYIDVTQQVGTVRAGNHSVELLADAAVIGMSPLAEAQARPELQGPLGPLHKHPDLRAVEHLAQGVGGWPYPLDGVRDGLSHSPAYLSQGVC